MKRDVRVYLDDILQSIKLLKRYTAGKTKEDYEKSDELHDLIHRRLEIIGEAAAHIPQEQRVKYSSIPWREIAGIRNILIHEYFAINDERIWKTVSVDIPNLAEQLEKMLRELDTEQRRK